MGVHASNWADMQFRMDCLLVVEVVEVVMVAVVLLLLLLLLPCMARWLIDYVVWG